MVDQSAKGEDTRPATAMGKEMQQVNQPSHERSLPRMEIDLEAIRRDLEYVHAESAYYLAYDLDNGEEAMAPTK